MKLCADQAEYISAFVQFDTYQFTSSGVPRSIGEVGARPGAQMIGCIYGILLITLPYSNRKQPEPLGYRCYKDRNCIEYMFNCVKQFRCIAA